MISFDTNLLFPSLEPSHPDHTGARAFIQSLPKDGAAICELVLVEVYVLTRNPAMCGRPLDGPSAVALIRTLRTNPDWRLIDYPGGLMEEVWNYASEPRFARRRVFDARLALTLRHHGVSQFATANVKDFQGFGFEKVWNPLTAA